jgi:hypothetical protein
MSVAWAGCALLASSNAVKNYWFSLSALSIAARFFVLLSRRFQTARLYVLLVFDSFARQELEASPNTMAEQTGQTEEVLMGPLHLAIAHEHHSCVLALLKDKRVRIIYTLMQLDAGSKTMK